MSWGWPLALLGLAAVPPLALGWVWANRNRDTGRRALGLPPDPASRRRAILWLLGLTLLLFALAQPRWGAAWQELSQRRLDLMVVLDVSHSMDARDTPPSRIERGRRALRDLPGLLTGGRVGLITAAGTPALVMPLTRDIDALTALAERISTDAPQTGGSDLGAAIDLALASLSSSDAPAILLVSDGEDLAGGARAASRRAADGGAPIYALGVGTPSGDTLPTPTGPRRAPDGRVVMSRLDLGLLRDLARESGGATIRAGPGGAELAALVRDGILADHRAGELARQRALLPVERYQWPLALGLLSLLLAERLGRRVLPLLGLLGLAAFSTGAGDARDLRADERRAEHLLTEGEPNAALGLYAEVASQADARDQRVRVSTNAGLAAARAGRLTESLAWLDAALAEDPEQPTALAAREIVARELELRQAPARQAPPLAATDEAPNASDAPTSTPPEGGAPVDGAEGPPGEEGDHEAEDTGGETAAPNTPSTDTPARGAPIDPTEARRLFSAVREGTPRRPGSPPPTGGRDW